MLCNVNWLDQLKKRKKIPIISLLRCLLLLLKKNFPLSLLLIALFARASAMASVSEIPRLDLQELEVPASASITAEI
jgi:hypothetical protein